METGKKTLEYLKNSGYSDEYTRGSLTKSLQRSELRNPKDFSRFSLLSRSTEQKFQEILEKINFFNKPDIIPYPFTDLDPENFSSRRLAQVKSDDTLISTKSSRTGKSILKKSGRKTSDKAKGTAAKTSRKGRSGKDKSQGSRERFGASSRSKSRGCDEQGYYCDTCVRVHRHEWAMVRP
jgi:hypothetical protein